jgi:Uma2 family endonuclease
MAVQLERIQSRKRLFNIDEYYRMAEAGILKPDEHVELVDGEIIKMSPIGSQHAACIDFLNRVLVRLSSDDVIIRNQNPIVLDDHSEPQPDIAIVRSEPNSYRNRHPTPADVFLIVDVADATVATDRHTKILIYARAGIPVAWIVNLPKNRVEVYTNPANGIYGTVEQIQRGQSLQVPGIPGATLRVDDILG